VYYWKKRFAIISWLSSFNFFLDLVGTATKMEMVTVTLKKTASGQPIRTSVPIEFMFNQKSQGGSGSATKLFSFFANIIILFCILI